jgi:hypothetical protein
MWTVEGVRCTNRVLLKKGEGKSRDGEEQVSYTLPYEGLMNEEAIKTGIDSRPPKTDPS